MRHVPTQSFPHSTSLILLLVIIVLVAGTIAVVRRK
jgi:hypothetical protein